MKIYEKNRRLLKNDGLTLRSLFGQEKLRLIKKGILEIQEKNWKFGVKQMNLSDLQDFNTLYTLFISKKKNAKVFELLERYHDRIQNTDEIYLWYLKDEQWHLLAWGLFVYKYDENFAGMLTVTWFRAYNPDIIFAKLKLGYYIEYLYYQRALEEKNPVYLSRGTDRNAYGTLGSNPWLSIHKLQYKFLPYKRGEEIEFDEGSIISETLIFINPDQEWVYTRAILYTTLSSEEIEKKYGLIQKRGIKLDIVYL